MPWVEFEPTIPASERAKIVHALDRSATVTGFSWYYVIKIYKKSKQFRFQHQMCGQLQSVHRIRGQTGPKARGLSDDTIISLFCIAPTDVAKRIEMYTCAGKWTHSV
jgi:hypothetical protein